MQTGTFAVAAAAAALSAAGGYAIGVTRADGPATDPALVRAGANRTGAELYLGTAGSLALPRPPKPAELRRKTIVVAPAPPAVRSTPTARVAAATTSPSGGGESEDNEGESD